MQSTQKAMHALHAAKLILESSTMVDSQAIREALVRISRDVLLNTAELLIKPEHKSESKHERNRHVPWAHSDFDVFYTHMMRFLHEVDPNRNSRTHCAHIKQLWSQYKSDTLQQSLARAKEAVLKGSRLRSLSEESV